jgi:hypothetical protein
MDEATFFRFLRPDATVMLASSVDLLVSAFFFLALLFFVAIPETIF